MVLMNVISTLRNSRISNLWMETPTRISGHASSSVCFPNSHEHSDEISASDDKTHGVEMACLELYDDSSVNYDLLTASMECQEGKLFWTIPVVCSQNSLLGCHEFV